MLNRLDRFLHYSPVWDILAFVVIVLLPMLAIMLVTTYQSANIDQSLLITYLVVCLLPMTIFYAVRLAGVIWHGRKVEVRIAPLREKAEQHLRTAIQTVVSENPQLSRDEQDTLIVRAFNSVREELR